jgi:hypothetical protein
LYHYTKEARAALARKETYAAELKRKLDITQQDVHRLSQETKLGRGERGRGAYKG